MPRETIDALALSGYGKSCEPPPELVLTKGQEPPAIEPEDEPQEVDTNEPPEGP